MTRAVPGAQAKRRSWGQGHGEWGAGAGESAPASPGGYGRRRPDGPCRRRRNLSDMGLLLAGPLRRIEGTRSDGAYREVGEPGGSCGAQERRRQSQMGSLAKRIVAVEKLYSAGSVNLAEGPEGWREAMSASLRRAEQKARAEEAQGDSRRRHALDSLYRFLER